LDDPDFGVMTVQAPAAVMSDTPGSVEHLGRALGADNGAVYRGLLDLSEARLAELQAAGVI
jgi:crotonobetainyl-CoA:carnitine CoA-transferase CaiB-like acyl-CoA transferase